MFNVQKVRNDSIFLLVVIIVALYISEISSNNGVRCFASTFESEMISQNLLQQDDALNNTVSPSSCPYMIYGKHWRKYLYAPDSKNHYSTSVLDRLTNIYIPLYNQSEWTIRFKEQPNPLSCPALYQQIPDGPMLSLFDPDEDASYQHGEKTYVCDQLDFKDNLGDVCDQLLCFSQGEKEKLFNQEKKFGINLTELIPTSLDDIKQDEFFGKRLTLYFVSRYIESIESRKLIPQEDDFISDEYNALLNQMIPSFNHNFSFGFELVDVFSACRSCRDYRKDPVIENRDICMTIDYPFSCESSEATEEDLEGVPMSSIGKIVTYNMAGDYSFFLTGYSLCFCPSRATLIEQGSDVNVTQSDSIIRIATKCDYYNDLWYPAYESGVLRKIYLAFELLVFLIAALLICIPLTVQGIMELILKISKTNIEIPKLHKAFRKRGPKQINKVLRKGVYFYKNNASSAIGKSWMRILFNIRFISAITLVWGSISFLVENALFLDTGFSIHSIHLIVNGYAGYYSSLLFVLALWIDTMIRVEKNSHNISLAIVIPLSVIMVFILVSSLVFVSFEFSIHLFYGIMIFYACTTFMFVMIMLLLVIYGAKIFIRLKVPLFQFKVSVPLSKMINTL